MEWAISGVWMDGNMPRVEELETRLFGTRYSPVLDITPAIKELKTIRSGRIYWRWNLPKYGLVDVEYSVDGGKTYTKVGEKVIDNKMFDGRNISYMPIAGASNDMELKMKMHLRSAVTDILPSDAVKIFEVEIVLSDKPETQWDKGKHATLEWDIDGW